MSMEALAHRISITETDHNPTNADGKPTWTVHVKVDGKLLRSRLILVDPHTRAEHDQCRFHLGQLLSKEQALDAKISNAERNQRRRSLATHLTEKSKLQADAKKTSSMIDDYRQNLYQQLQLPTDQLVKPILRIDVREQSTKQTSPGARTIHCLHWEQLEAAELWKSSSIAQVVVRRIVAQRCQPARPSNQPPEAGIQRIKSWSTQKHSKPSLNVLLVVARDLSNQYNVQIQGQHSDARSSSANPVQDTDPSLAQLAILGVRKKLQRLERAHCVRLMIVRPGTFEALAGFLRHTSQTQGKGYFSIIHFDVHGSVEREGPRQTAYLQFADKESGGLGRRSARDIAQLVQDHNIPCAVINACVSATASMGINANLSRTFIHMGIPNVVAMSDKFSSCASANFQISFYEAFLSELRTFSEAAAIARRDLREYKLPPGGTRRGTKVQDWFVPVVYTSGRELQVTLSESHEPRLSWNSQSARPTTKSKNITSLRQWLSTIHHLCTAIPKRCRLAYQQSTKRDLFELPGLIIRSIEDERNLLALDNDTLALESDLTEDRIVVLYGTSDHRDSTKLRRLSRLWLETGFVHEVHYIEAHQFLNKSPRLSARLNESVHNRGVADVYPLPQSTHNEDYTSAPQVVLIIDHVDALFPAAKVDKWQSQGQQRLINFIQSLPKKVADHRYPSIMPYLMLLGTEDPEWWKKKFKDVELDWIFRKRNQSASYRRIV